MNKGKFPEIVKVAEVIPVYIKSEPVSKKTTDQLEFHVVSQKIMRELLKIKWLISL